MMAPTVAQAIRISSRTASLEQWVAVERYCPNAVRCMDPFHVVSWATDALDQLRREVWNAARKDGQHAVASDLKGARWALWRNPEDLSDHQRGQLADIARTNRPLYRGYLLKVNSARPSSCRISAPWTCSAAG